MSKLRWRGEMFETIPGHEDVKGYLTTALKKGAIGQSLLFTGSDIEAMGKFATEFACATLSHAQSHHPDLHIYHPEGKLGMHSIESMRRLSEEVYLTPFEGHRKVFILYQAERMLPTSSNALLKTFEEPAEDTLIILISNQPELLLPTIRSRCRIVRFTGEASPVEVAEIPELYEELYQVLRVVRFGTYKDMTQHTEKMGALFEAHKKERAKVLREEMLNAYTAKATLAQTEAIDKESEGIAAMECAAIVKKVMERVVYWYRDLELIKMMGETSQLIHKDEINHLKKQSPIGLNDVVEFVHAAQLAYQRSTSFSLCLENLFLKLGKI